MRVLFPGIEDHPVLKEMEVCYWPGLIPCLPSGFLGCWQAAGGSEG